MLLNEKRYFNDKEDNTLENGCFGSTFKTCEKLIVKDGLLLLLLFRLGFIDKV